MASHSPFLINFAGKLGIFEAPNVAEALKMATGNTVTVCKVATGKEYAAFLRGGGKVVVVGEQPIPADKVLPDRGAPALGGDLVPGGVDGAIVDEIRSEPVIREVEEAVDRAVEHAGDGEKLRHGHAEEIAVEGDGKVARKPATKAPE